MMNFSPLALFQTVKNTGYDLLESAKSNLEAT